MRINNTFFKLLTLTCVLPMLNSCSSYTAPNEPKSLRKIGSLMDRMAADEAEFGSMGISSPVIDEPDSNFTFQFSPTGTDFFKDAKSSLQGTASNLDQSSISAGLGLNVTVNPTAAAGYLAQLSQYQQAIGNNNAAQAFTDNKNALQNSLAQAQYNADMNAANLITDPTNKAAAVAKAGQTLLSSLVGPNTVTPPAFPTAPTQSPAPTGLVTPPKDLLQQFTNNGAFNNAPAIPSSLGVTDRTAVLTAAGDNTTSAIFKLLGDPALANKFKDRRVLFGVSTVAVNPGWRTKKGYAADISMIVSYDWVPARREVLIGFIKDLNTDAAVRARLASDCNLTTATGDPHFTKAIRSKSYATVIPKELDYNLMGNDTATPHVAAISPLTDTQTLDLQSSFRQQQQLSLQIAAQFLAAGATAQGQAFLEYAHSLQQDFATVSPDVVANAYSTGSMFGFQIGPKLRTIEQVRKGTSSGPAEILDRQAFPILVLIGLDNEDIRPKISVNESGLWQLWERRMSMQSVNQWVETEDHSIRRFFLGDRSRILTESEKLALSQASNLLATTKPTPTNGNDVEGIKNKTFMLAKARMASLKTRLFGGQAEIYLPSRYIDATLVSLATSVNPAKIPPGISAQIVLTGQNLENIDLSTSAISVVSGEDDSAKTSFAPQFVGGAILVNLNPKTAKAPIVLKFQTKSGEAVYSPPIQVVDPLLPQISDRAPDVAALDTDTSIPAGATATPKPHDFTVIVTGSNLTTVDTANITGLPSGSVTINKSLKSTNGDALTLTVTISKADSPIYFQIPIQNSSQILITPPINIKIYPPPANAVTATTPTVLQVNPSSVVLTKDTNGKLAAQTVTADILGTNLDQIDPSNITISSGNASIATTSKPQLIGGAIQIVFTINDASASVVFTLPFKNTASKPITTPQIKVTAP